MGSFSETRKMLKLDCLGLVIDFSTRSKWKSHAVAPSLDYARDDNFDFARNDNFDFARDDNFDFARDDNFDFARDDNFDFAIYDKFITH